MDDEKKDKAINIRLSTTMSDKIRTMAKEKQIGKATIVRMILASVIKKKED